MQPLLFYGELTVLSRFRASHGAIASYAYDCDATIDAAVLASLGIQRGLLQTHAGGRFDISGDNRAILTLPRAPNTGENEVGQSCWRCELIRQCRAKRLRLFDALQVDLSRTCDRDGEGADIVQNELDQESTDSPIAIGEGVDVQKPAQHPRSKLDENSAEISGREESELLHGHKPRVEEIQHVGSNDSRIQIEEFFSR